MAILSVHIYHITVIGLYYNDMEDTRHLLLSPFNVVDKDCFG
jgi:hypothetical protein